MDANSAGTATFAVEGCIRTLTDWETHEEYEYVTFNGECADRLTRVTMCRDCEYGRLVNSRDETFCFRFATLLDGRDGCCSWGAAKGGRCD